MKFANNEIAERYEEMMEKPIRQMFDDFFAECIELKDEDIEFISSGFKYKFMQLIQQVNLNVQGNQKISPKQEWIAKMLGEFSFSKEEYNSFLASFPREVQNKSPRLPGRFPSYFYSGRAPILRKQTIDHHELQRYSFRNLLNYADLSDHNLLTNYPRFYNNDFEERQEIINTSPSVVLSKTLGQKLLQTGKDNIQNWPLAAYSHAVYHKIDGGFFLPYEKMETRKMDWARIFTEHVLKTKKIHNYGIFDKAKVRFNGIGKEKHHVDNTV